MSGRATENRIDVLWEFQQASGQLMRLVFECRSYKRRISQPACRRIQQPEVGIPLGRKSLEVNNREAENASGD